MHQALPLFPCPTTAPGDGSGLNDAGFQIMTKQSTAQGRAKKPDKSAPGGTRDKQAPTARTTDAPNAEVRLATMLAKIDKKFEALCREQFSPAPATADPSSQPDEQSDGGRPVQPVSRHRASDSECTDSDSPAEEIEMRTHRKAKRHGSTSTSGSTASDMGWAQLGDEVT